MFRNFYIHFQTGPKFNQHNGDSRVVSHYNVTEI